MPGGRVSLETAGRSARGADGRRGTPGDRQVSASLPPDVASAAAARRLVTAALRSWGVEQLAWAGCLAVTELVTNALLHGRPPVTVTVRRLPRRRGVRVEVGDGSRRLPAQRRHGETAVTGRGLRLLAAVSARTGVELTDSGKIVWADLVAG